MSHAVVTAMIALLVAGSAVAWLARSRAARLVLDTPNFRSLHKTPTPRTGGIGILLGIAASWLVVSPRLPYAWWAAMALIVAVSLADDLLELRASFRLCAHLLAATLAALSLLPADVSPWLLTTVIVGIAWMANLYNFMDGSDGLAGGMAFVGFGAYAAAAWQSGSTQFACLNLGIAFAAAGFLPHNFHPARIFMGDAGAVTLGFLAGTLGLLGWLQADWSWWFPFLVFSPFIADASLTLVRRAASGARIWEAHRDHYYQRLVLMGLGHRNTALAEYALMICSAAAALWALTLPPDAQWYALIAAIMLYLALAGAITCFWRQRNSHAA